MIYLYKNHTHLSVYKEDIDAANSPEQVQYGIALLAPRSTPAISRRRRIPIKKKHANFIKECRAQLNNMNRSEKNLPVVITGENSLDYIAVSTYMNTK